MIKWTWQKLFGKPKIQKFPRYCVSIDGVELGETTGEITYSQKADYVEVRNDQSCTVQAKIKKAMPIPCGNDSLTVGTYNLSINGYDAGSTTGGCTISRSSDMPLGQYKVSTKLQSVDKARMELLGFWELTENVMRFPKQAFVHIKTLEIVGPGPGCGTRVFRFEDVKLDLRNFEYTISKDHPVEIPLEFIVSGGTFDEDLNTEVACKTLPEGESFV